MRSLFLKIFLSYWVAQALFILLAILITIAVRQRAEFWEPEELKFVSGAIQAYETGGQAEAGKYFEDAHTSEHPRVYAFDDHAVEISGRPVPRWATYLQRGLAPPPRDFWERVMPTPFERRTVTASSGRRYVIAVMTAPGPFGPRGIPGLGLGIGLLSSGIVCYLLARYLTRPVVRLRAATQKLAAGDLTARAGGAGSRRGDEIAQLVRDFDSMAERLERLVNAQSRLLHDISHELRSPLARLNVALALARQRTGPGADSALDRIDLESERLNELIGRLLIIARLESGSDAGRRVPIQLEELVADIAADADFEAQGRDCRVKPVVVDNCEVVGIPALLRSAIENVVRNAVRYTREGTDIEVRLSTEEGAHGLAVIRVTDSGPGVPEEALDKLFRPFYRIEDARERQKGGVGLGLAITERAIRLHGGTVRAANRPQGGLMVEIRLPLARGEVVDLTLVPSTTISHSAS